MSIPEDHWNRVVLKLLRGKVVLFLGAAANTFMRPSRQWQRGRDLPDGRQLAEYLAEKSEYNGDDKDKPDLLRVAQYMELVAGSADLYEALRELLDAEHPKTPLHDLIAKLPRLMRSLGQPRSYPLIITTNYDDVLERAFREQKEPFDTLYYAAEGKERGMFWHVSDAGAATLIEKPNEYLAVSPSARAVILKIHGNMDRTDAERDSYVITEDHYIDYLTRTDISSLLPVTVVKTMKSSSFLFLGYGLQDWNLRVIFHRIWGDTKLRHKSWAVQLRPKELDRKFWARRDVNFSRRARSGDSRLARQL